jgi:hypothetical protein
MRTPWLIIALALLAPSPAHARQAAAQAPAPDGLAEFAGKITDYLGLRVDLEKGLPALSGADDPVQVRAYETTLAGRIRDARKGARQGDLFTPQATAAIRKILRQIDSGTWRMIMDANPGSFPNRVNDAYPKDKPLSTMPPDLLARLPRLPEGLQYRFVGTDLILHDTRANLILDRIPEAIGMAGPRR